MNGATGRANRSRIFGFNLVELAVVLAIIGVLFAMLLPAAVSAKEKAARAKCRQNLNLQGKAIEQYCTDYADYFPGWPGMDQHEPKVRMAYVRTTVTDRATKETLIVTTGNVGAQTLNRFAAVNAAGGIARWRSIGIGMREQADGSFTDWRAGRFNMAPIKMGLTLTLGYLTDMAPMYCPSGKDMDVVAYDTSGARDFATRELDSLAEMQQLGGTDAKAFTHGDYSWLQYGNFRLPPGYIGATASSHYNYRPTPFMIADVMDDSPCAVPLSNPKVAGLNGEAMFLTPKQLGGHALLCDTFDKCYNAQPGQLEFSAGTNMHQDGYNVLYGDGHAAWYEDEKKEIAGWPPTGQSECHEVIQHLYSSSSDRHDCSDTDRAAFRCSGGPSFTVWNMFDKANNVDMVPLPTPTTTLRPAPAP